MRSPGKLGEESDDDDDDNDADAGNSLTMQLCRCNRQIRNMLRVVPGPEEELGWACYYCFLG